MKIEPKDILIALTICSILGAFLLWVLGLVLTDKKDKMALAFRVEKLEEIVKNLKIDGDKIDPIITEMEVIKERIKHL